MTLVVDGLTAESPIQNFPVLPDSTEARYADGAKDATYGRLPEYADDAYLAGYVAQLKQLPTQENGRIRHYSPCQHFAFGFMDGIGDGIDGESIREYF